MPTNETTGNTVAVYWDFENLHAALYERDWGGSRYYFDNRYTPQNVYVNIKAVMDYAASLGDVAINRAYNNWQWFFRYTHALNSSGIDLIQIYSKGARAKNGADIRLALDVLEDVFRYPKLTHVVIVSSDSDFISLAQKLKQSGLTVIGVGVQQATNAYWAQNCDEFRYYDTLLGLVEDAERAVPEEGRHDEHEDERGEEEDEATVRSMSLDDAKKLTLDALRRLIAQRGSEQVPRTSLKLMMKRMDSTFDEANLGFFSFSSFIKAFPDVVEDLTDDSGGQVRLRSAAEQAEAKIAPAQVTLGATEQDYEMVLKRGNVRLLPAPWWRRAVEIVDDIFRTAPDGELPSFDELEGELAYGLSAAGLDSSEEIAHKLRGFLFALWQFQLDKERHTIRLKTHDVSLLSSVEREIVRRIVKFAAPPIDVAQVASILYDKDAPDKTEDARQLVESITRMHG